MVMWYYSHNWLQLKYLSHVIIRLDVNKLTFNTHYFYYFRLASALAHTMPTWFQKPNDPLIKTQGQILDAQHLNSQQKYTHSKNTVSYCCVLDARIAVCWEANCISSQPRLVGWSSVEKIFESVNLCDPQKLYCVLKVYKWKATNLTLHRRKATKLRFHLIEYLQRNWEARQYYNSLSLNHNTLMKIPGTHYFVFRFSAIIVWVQRFHFYIICHHSSSLISGIPEFVT